MTGKEKENLARCYLRAMDTGEDNPGFPDGIQARVNDDGSLEFATFKLAHGPGEGWFQIDEVPDTTIFGDGWVRVGGTYDNDENLEDMVYQIKDSMNEIEERIREEIDGEERFRNDPGA